MGRRQHAPAKRSAINARRGAQDGNAKEKEMMLKDEAPLEDIDPDEPRYCLCGDVSYGEMVACENPNVSRSFFLAFSSLLILFLNSKTDEIVTVREGMVPFRVCGFDRVSPKEVEVVLS